MEFAIEVKQLSKSYPGIKAIDNVTFSVKKGEIHGLLGPNGAGKTTTMNCLSGLIKPDQGTFTVNGQIAYLPENPPLYKDMVVETYLKFIAGIHNIKGSELKENLEFSIEKVGLSSLTKRMIGNLSKGQKQRVGLASILIQKKDILILDEPTVGLDPESIIEIRKLITDLKGSHTILLSTHQLREIELCSDSISIINKGRVVLSEKCGISQDEISYEIEILNYHEGQFLKLKSYLGELDITLCDKKLNGEKLKLLIQGPQGLDKKMGQFTSFIVQNGMLISKLNEIKAKNNLEDIYLNAIGMAGVKSGETQNDKSNLSTLS